MARSLNNFGKNLKHALVDKDMKQVTLAEKCGVSFYTISKFTRGECTPGAELLIKIADVLGVTVDSLIK